MTFTQIIHDKLIEFFANHSVDEIQEEGGKLLKRKIGARSYRDISDDLEYKILFNTLLEIRADLEIAIESGISIQQVKRCLFLLHKKRKSQKDFELLTKLIKKGIYREWAEEQKNYFDFGVEMMSSWKDYFLSYTNRNFNETNNCLEEVLSKVLDPGVYKNNKNNSNCVAYLIKKYLDENGLVGFLDKHEMAPGDQIEKKIRDHCTSVFAFVQLVEMVMFTKKKERRNWCWKEFETFNRWVNKIEPGKHKRYYFIHPYKKEVLFPADLTPEYEEWKTNIIETLFIGNLCEMNIEKIRYEMHILAGEIEKTRESILKDYYTDLPV